jgi:hypothetical protein
LAVHSELIGIGEKVEQAVPEPKYATEIRLYREQYRMGSWKPLAVDSHERCRFRFPRRHADQHEPERTSAGQLVDEDHGESS